LSDAISIVAITGVAVIAYLTMSYGLARRMRFHVRTKLEPQEQMIYEAYVLRVGPFWAGLRDGVISVTNRRVLLGVWNLPFVWPTIDFLNLSDLGALEDLKYSMRIRVGDRTIFVMPKANELWPISGSKTKLLVNALEAAKA